MLNSWIWAGETVDVCMGFIVVRARARILRCSTGNPRLSSRAVISAHRGRARSTGCTRARPGRGGVGRGLHAPHRAARTLVLSALWPWPVPAHRANCACAAVHAASAGTAVSHPMRSRFACRALGASPRQACARPLRLVRATHAFTGARARTSLPFLSVQNACAHLIGRLHRLTRRLTPVPARLQSP